MQGAISANILLALRFEHVDRAMLIGFTAVAHHHGAAPAEREHARLSVQLHDAFRGLVHATIAQPLRHLRNGERREHTDDDDDRD